MSKQENLTRHGQQYRTRKTFTIHPDAISALRLLAENDREANGSMSRMLEILIFDAQRRALVG